MRFLPRFRPLVLIPAVALLLRGASEPTLHPGQEIADLALVDAQGKPHLVRHLIDSKAALFVVVPRAAEGDLCAIAAALKGFTLQEALPLAVLLAGSPQHPRECASTAGPVAFYHRPSAAPSGQPDSRAVAILIDDSFHVRWRASLAEGPEAWSALAAGVNTWLQGRQSYEANCGHCHGMDGAQASAPETKSLVGITKKYSGEDVLRLGAQFGGVDMTGWSDAKRETLLTYIRGL